MRILILTFGSRADVQPYVALGAALPAEPVAATAAELLETVAADGGRRPR